MTTSHLTFLAQATVTASVPTILAGLGELVAERAGVINIGIEGLMLLGAFAAYATATATSSPALGLLAAVASASALALLFAIATITFRADQIVTGTATNLLAAGITTTAWALLEPKFSLLPPTPGYDRLPLPYLSHIPLLGPALFNQYALCYALGILLALTALILRTTRTGLILHALGDAPDAASAAGIPVRLSRTLALLFAGATAGLAGSYLSIMRVKSFSPDMTGGQGFLVLALVIFGRWRISGLLAGALLFGLVDATQQFLRGYPATANLPPDLFKMLPYLATLLALTLLPKSTTTPSHLAQPWPATP